MRLLKWWSNFLEEIDLGDTPAEKATVTICAIILAPVFTFLLLLAWPLTITVIVLWGGGYLLKKIFEKLEG